MGYGSGSQIRIYVDHKGIVVGGADNSHLTVLLEYRHHIGKEWEVQESDCDCGKGEQGIRGREHSVKLEEDIVLKVRMYNK